jgi:hypothetical protein
VLEQIEYLGHEIVPALRKLNAEGRPSHIPDAPTHESMKAKAGASPAAG